MPSFNYGRYLTLAIESVLSQSHCNLELIIADDCSTDGSREIAEHWRSIDERVLTVSHERNLGLAATRNSALAVSSGKFVALCDADDIWLPNKLKTQLACFNDRPELGLVHADSAIIDEYGELTGQRFSLLIHARQQKTSGDVFLELCQRNFLCVPTVIVRREALDYAGGFDVRLRSLEDWVCWTKISRKYRFHYIDDILVQYRVHGASLSHDVRGMAQNRARALQALLRMWPDIPQRCRSAMLYSLGMSHLETREPRSAISAFVESIGANPVHIRSWVRLCQAVLKSVTYRESNVA